MTVTAEDKLKQYLIETIRFKNRLGLIFPAEYPYQGGEDYVLDRGSLFPSCALTNKEKTIIQTALNACPVKRFSLGHCYFNAQILVAHDPSGELHYCEGFAMGLTGHPTLHGWIGINGKVLDITWRVPNRGKGKFRDRVWGLLPEGWAYYGASFGNEMLLARIGRIRATGSFLDDVAHGFPLFREPRLLCPTLET